MLRWIIFIIVCSILSFYSFQALKTVTRHQWIYWIYLVISVLIIGNFIYQFTYGELPGRVLSRPKSYAFGLLMAILVFQIITILFLFSEDLFRLLSAGYQKLVGTSKEFNIPTRRRFLSTLALGIAALPFSALLYGMYSGKYNFKVLKYNLEFDDLPDGFDGYQITQISDIHSGSFDNRNKIEYAIDLINEQKSDTILFTGDLVNNKAEEMHPWKDLFSKLDESLILLFLG